MRARAFLLAGFAVFVGQAGLPGVAAAEAASPWSAGLQSRGFVDFEPGNDFAHGLQAGYAPASLFGWNARGRLELRAAYLTSLRDRATVTNYLARRIADGEIKATPPPSPAPAPPGAGK